MPKELVSVVATYTDPRVIPGTLFDWETQDLVPDVWSGEVALLLEAWLDEFLAKQGDQANE
jgi:hypothetical protein